MLKDNYLLNTVSEIISSSQAFLKNSLGDHSDDFLGKDEGDNPLVRLHSHLHEHCREIFDHLSDQKEKNGSKEDQTVWEALIENANLVAPHVNKRYYSCLGMNEIKHMPIIDNHAHAGFFENRMNSPEGMTYRKIVDFFEIITAFSLLNPKEGKELWEIYHSEKKEDVEEYFERKGIKDECLDALENFKSTSMWNMLAGSFKDLYPGALTEQDMEIKIEEQREMGLNASYSQIFDKANITTCLCLRPDLDTGWDKQRFKRVVELDPFMSLNFKDDFFKSTLNAMEIDSPPTKFDDYIDFLDEMIDYFVGEEALAVKIHSAYVRPIFFQKRTVEEAKKSFEETYRPQKSSGKQKKSLEEVEQYSKTEKDRLKQHPFQDFVARRLIELCGENDLPVHFHTGSGFLPGLELKNSSPLNLENIIGDPKLRKTKMVILHAGYPFFRESVNLSKMWSNVYLDISGLTFMFNFSLANFLTETIEFLPANKILFGTDAVFPELFHTAAQNGRKQLSIALENLVNANTLSSQRARKIAESILSGNAKRLYGL